MALYSRHLQRVRPVGQKHLDTAGRLIVLPAIGKLATLRVQHRYVHVGRHSTRRVAATGAFAAWGITLARTR